MESSLHAWDRLRATLGAGDKARGVRAGRLPHAAFRGFSFYKRLALLSETRDVFLLRSGF